MDNISTVRLILATIFPVVASVSVYICSKRTRFGKLSYMKQQTVIGIVFGLIAVFGTEFGISYEGYTMNVRDAAPVSAGLLFGLPAGVIAGLIGGIERYFAAYWGAGFFTQLACTFGTILSGLIAGLLRKYIFYNRKPPVLVCLFYGVTLEVLHMLMVFLTNLNDSAKAFEVISVVSLPMIALNGLAVMFSAYGVSFVHRFWHTDEVNTPWLSYSFQKTMLIIVASTLIVTAIFTSTLASLICESGIQSVLIGGIRDVKAAVNDASDRNLLKITKQVASSVDRLTRVSYGTLSSLRRSCGVTEIDVADENGILIQSTNQDFIGFDFHSGPQAQEFLVLLDGETESYVQDYGPISYDESQYRKYAGYALKNGGFVQVGYDSDMFYEDLAEQVNGITRNRRIGETGFLMICDEDYTIVSDSNGHEGQYLFDSGLIHYQDFGAYPSTIMDAVIYGQQCSYVYENVEGYFIVAALPWAEGYSSQMLSLYLLIFMETLVMATLFAAIYYLIQRKIVIKINDVCVAMKSITEGDLNLRLDVRGSREFEDLSDSINTTVDTMNRYIDEAAARIDKDLALARNIQLSSLPHVFPSVPYFELWAATLPAKEVGGDFYDYYLLPGKQLAFLIADVSGKGIPAAMFMMTAKSIIKGFAEQGMAVNDIFTHANDALCASNDAGMFITAWMGILDLRTGLVRFANAGHNPPLVRHAGGSYEYLKSRAGFVLAGLDGFRYRCAELQLQPGDSVYLYTDGVTEATDANDQLYGEDRLIEKLNSLSIGHSPEETCKKVKADVDAFVGEAPQFDDITMLCLNLNHLLEGDRF